MTTIIKTTQDSLSTEVNMHIQLHSYDVFCSRDSDLDPMTLIHQCVVDILKMYLHAINEVSRSRLSKVKAQTGHTHTQTDKETDMTKCITKRYPQMAIRYKYMYYPVCLWTGCTQTSYFANAASYLWLTTLSLLPYTR